MNRSQKGFTLIELMIVVAIIAILAAIAIPQYQNYVARSQVTRVLGETAALKTAAEDCLLNGHTDFTDADTCGQTIPTSTLVPAGIEVDISSAEASITATIGGGSPAVAGAVVTWSRSAAGDWTCVLTEGDAAAGWKPSYVPSGCPSA